MDLMLEQEIWVGELTIYLYQNKWKEIIKNSVNIVSFHLDRICKSTNDIRIRGKKIREIIFPFLIMIKSSIEKSAYINEIHNKTGIAENAIIEDYKNYEKTNGTNINIVNDKPKEIKDINSRRNVLEKKLFGIISWQKGKGEHKDKISQLVSLFESDIGTDDFQKMLILYEPFSDTLAFEAEMWYGDKINILLEDTKEIILNLEEEIFKDKAMFLLTKINEEEHSNDKENIKKDLMDYQKIVEKIAEIKSRRAK